MIAFPLRLLIREERVPVVVFSWAACFFPRNICVKEVLGFARALYFFLQCNFTIIKIYLLYFGTSNSFVLDTISVSLNGILSCFFQTQFLLVLLVFLPLPCCMARSYPAHFYFEGAFSFIVRACQPIELQCPTEKAPNNVQLVRIV